MFEIPTLKEHLKSERKKAATKVKEDLLLDHPGVILINKENIERYYRDSIVSTVRHAKRLYGKRLGRTVFLLFSSDSYDGLGLRTVERRTIRGQEIERDYTPKSTNSGRIL